MADLNIYRPGETIEITGTITNSSNAAANPTVSTKVRIADTLGTVKVEATAMTNEATGSYYYAHDLPVAAIPGEWTYEVITTDGDNSDVSIGSGTFIVKARAITPV